MSDLVTAGNTPIDPAQDLVASDYSGDKYPRAELTQFEGFGLVHVSEIDDFKSEYVECSVRHVWFPSGDAYTAFNGDAICPDERSENWFEDADNGDLYPNSERVLVYDSRGRSKYVSEYTRERNYRYCNYYDEYYPIRGGREVPNCGWVSGWGLQNGDFITCEECGNYRRSQDLDDGYCESCSGSGSSRNPHAIRDYDSTAYPKAMRLPNENASVRLFGVENEVEVKSGNDRDRCAKNVIEALGSDFAILKSDGSLNHGFEIVTAPASLAVHSERWKKLCVTEPADPRLGLRSAKTETCGLHVHASRCDLKSDLHLGRILVFMNDPAHKSFIEGLARRAETDWCRIAKKKLTDGRLRLGDGTKYVAVNLNHHKTIEFRVFKGTLTYRHFMSSIEFVDALFDFTSPATASFSDLNPHAFSNFVKGRRKRWPHLTNELVALGYLPQSARFGGKGKDVSVEVSRMDVEKIRTETISVGASSLAPSRSDSLESLRASFQDVLRSGLDTPFHSRTSISEPPTPDELTFMHLITDPSVTVTQGDWMADYNGEGRGEWVDGMAGTPARHVPGRVYRFDPNSILHAV